MTFSPCRTVLACLLSAACTGSPTAATSPPPSVATEATLDVRALSEPVGWLATRIGGPQATVQVLPPPGSEPSTWRPSAEAIADLAGADLIVAQGAGYEAWTATATLPDDRTAYTGTTQATLHLKGEPHSHGAEGHHSHEQDDPHTWLDPVRFAQQAELVAAALTNAAPQHADVFTERRETVQRQLKGLHTRQHASLSRAHGSRLASTGPKWAYLADRYQLELRSVPLDPSSLPTPEQLAAVTTWLSVDDNPHLLLWATPPTDEVKAALPPGVIHLVVDPLDRSIPNTKYDYLLRSEANAVTFEAAFGSTRPR